MCRLGKEWPHRYSGIFSGVAGVDTASFPSTVGECWRRRSLTTLSAEEACFNGLGSLSSDGLWSPNSVTAPESLPLSLLEGPSASPLSKDPLGDRANTLGVQDEQRSASAPGRADEALPGAVTKEVSVSGTQRGMLGLRRAERGISGSVSCEPGIRMAPRCVDWSVAARWALAGQRYNPLMVCELKNTGWASATGTDTTTGPAALDVGTISPSPVPAFGSKLAEGKGRLDEPLRARVAMPTSPFSLSPPEVTPARSSSLGMFVTTILSFAPGSDKARRTGGP